jgi:hypothetical protein
VTTSNVELYALVAEELGLISNGETLDANTSDMIARRETKVRAWLIEEAIAYWISDAIPDAAALPYAQVVAGQCAEAFGRGPNSDNPYLLGETGYRLLERHVSQRSSKEPVMVEYF